MERTAILFGGTGLVGSFVLRNLLDENLYDKVLVFTRDPIQITSRKMTNHVIRFDRLDEYAALIQGDDLFCCLGTTIRKAKSQEAFRLVDYEYPVQIAQIAKKNQVKGFYVVSSLGANAHSGNYYLRTKGEMENRLMEMDFEKIAILRPSLLLGERKEFRFGEMFAKVFMYAAGWMLMGRMKRYRGVRGSDVAKAMIHVARINFKGRQLCESDAIARMASI